jgi:phage baseplate assembly protein W|tara:strand:+ start:34 stop:435 length:402 start_codon:yes stop_codon:yes gene_type:complete
MPVERVSRGFKDISMSFEVNPINNDIIGVKNDTAIARSIRNLVFTVPGERFFNEDLGSKVSQVLFDTVDDISAASIKDEIEETIIKYEPRVELKDIRVEPDFDNHNFNVTIVYDVVGIDALTQQLNFALQPTR